MLNIHIKQSFMWLSMTDLEQLHFLISHYFCWGYVPDHKSQSETLRYNEKEMQLEKKNKNWKDDKHAFRSFTLAHFFFSQEPSFPLPFLLDFQPFYFLFLTKRKPSSPGQVARLVGASSCTPKFCRFGSWSGHLKEAANQCFFFISHFPPTAL